MCRVLKECIIYILNRIFVRGGNTKHYVLVFTYEHERYSYFLIRENIMYALCLK